MWENERTWDLGKLLTNLFFVWRIHIWLQNFCNFYGSWDIEYWVILKVVYTGHILTSCNFFVLAFWVFKPPETNTWGSKLSDSCIGFYTSNWVWVERVLWQSIPYALLWMTTWRFFRNWNFYLLYLLHYIYKNIPTSIIQGCWFQIWYLFFQVPRGFQLIKSQSCQKVVYTGPTSEVFYTIFLYRGNFNFFLKMIVFFWSFLPSYYFFLFFDIFWVIDGFIKQGWGRI